MEKLPLYLCSKTSKSLQQNISASLSEAALRRCSPKQLLLKLCNIHRKTPALESLFSKLYQKQTPTRVFSREYCEIFKERFFHRTPSVAASGLYHYLLKLLLRKPFSYFVYFNPCQQSTQRSNCSQNFFKKRVLKDFHRFHKEHLCSTLFIKKTPQRRGFVFNNA